MTIAQIANELLNAPISTSWSEIQELYARLMTQWEQEHESVLSLSPTYLVATDEAVASLLPGIALEISSFLEDLTAVEAVKQVYEGQSRLHGPSRRVYGPMPKTYFPWAIIPVHSSFASDILPAVDRPLGLLSARVIGKLRGDTFPALPERFESYRGYTANVDALPLTMSAATEVLGSKLDPSFDLFVADEGYDILVVSAVVKG